MQVFHLTLLSEALSPISHHRGTEGNEAVLSREPIHTDRGKYRVPCLSGNSLRHHMIRRPAALWLIEELGLKGRLSLAQLHFLLHGGTLIHQRLMENTQRIARMYELFPLLRLLGGSLPDQVLPGCLFVGRGRLVCEQNRPFLTLPAGYELPNQALLPAEYFVDRYQYIQGTARTRSDWYDPDKPSGQDERQGMIYAGEFVLAGALFLHCCLAQQAKPVDIGCLVHALSLWQEQGGLIGGLTGRGHGRLRTWILAAPPELDEWASLYQRHVQEHAEECRAWLEEAFAEVSSSAGRRKKRGRPAKTAEAAPSDSSEGSTASGESSCPTP